MTRLRSALWLPIFDDLAEPAVACWHGVSLDRVRGILRDGPVEIGTERTR